MMRASVSVLSSPFRKHTQVFSLLSFSVCLMEWPYRVSSLDPFFPLALVSTDGLRSPLNLKLCSLLESFLFSYQDVEILSLSYH